jgi:hypothetical protein
VVLRRAGNGYVFGVVGTEQFLSWGKPELVSKTAEEIDPELT